MTPPDGHIFSVGRSWFGGRRGKAPAASPDAPARAPAPAPPPLKLVLALPLAVAGGILQVLAWPTFNLWPLTFVCLVPLFHAARGQKPGRAFFLGWAYGLSLGLSGFYWLGEVMAGYGGLGDFGGLCVLLLLAAFLALHQGLWAMLTAGVAARAAREAFSGAVITALAGAVLWTGFDWLKNYLLTGFNWTPLAGGLAGCLPLLGPADIVGVYGLGLPVAFAGLLLARFADFRLPRGPGLLSLCLALFLTALMYSHGHSKLKRYDLPAAADSPSSAPPPKTLALLQASVPQDRKWDPVFRDEILGRFESLVQNAKSARPWLTVWPETAVPFLYGFDRSESLWLENLVARSGLDMLVGLGAADVGGDGGPLLHNRAWLTENGRIVGTYDKTHLVPFGEYIPLADVLPFFKWPFVKGLIGAAGTYSPGERRPDLVHRGVKIGLMICFESIFPYMAYEKANAGAGLLVVTTNDAWFGLSLAPEQHLAQAVMRAVETRLPLARAANNGISAVIAPSGRILERSVRNDVRTLVWELEIPENPGRTLFTRGGHHLAAVCGWLTAAHAFFRLARRLAARRKKSLGKDMTDRGGRNESRSRGGGKK
ncbi:MAG: apolipoprotein N-acyltransferase [Deltaproteobacteria bacterium]|nr:apolipoprotein N-acyltransferase [Deltaproteobacteria bacterium]